MALYALENVDDALDVTRDFLAGIDRWTWLKLAVVVFFVGGAGGGFPGYTGSPPATGDAGAPPGEAAPTFDPGPEFWLFVAAIAALVLALIVFFGVVGATMEFVFVESLRTETVSVREYFGRYWRKGVRLFVFKFAVGSLLLVAVGLLAIVAFAPLLLDVGVGLAWLLLALLVGAPLFIVLALLTGLVTSFTTVFVVPIMLLEDCGVLAGWRRLWPSVKAEWKQYLAYAVGAWILSIAGGIVAFILGAVLLVVLLIPFGVLFAVGFGLFAVAETVGIAWFVLFGVLFGVGVLLAFALAQVPVQTYLRYYALLVLGDVESAFDVVPEQRAAVRDDESDTGPAA